MITRFKCLVILLLLFVACGPAGSKITKSLKTELSVDPAAAHIFVMAHADDWQLFAGEFAFDAIANPATRVAIILTDAGDAGKPDSYWQAREQAHLASIRSVLHYPLEDGDASEALSTFAGDGVNVAKRHLRNVAVYTLRLPDGEVDGGGTVTRNAQSMARLYHGRIGSITSVDGANTYTLDRLRSTIASLVQTEGLASGRNVLYTLDPGTVRRLSHSDHFMTHVLLREALATKPLGNAECKFRAFADYRTQHKSANASADVVAKRFQLFTAYDQVMMQKTNTCSLCITSHYEWLYRTYVKEFDCT